MKQPRRFRETINGSCSRCRGRPFVLDRSDRMCPECCKYVDTTPWIVRFCADAVPLAFVTALIWVVLQSFTP